MFCPRAGPSLQEQGPRLQFRRRQVFHRKLRNQGCSSAEGRSSTANSGTKTAVLPKAGLPPQTQEPRLQFCRRQVFYRKLRNQGCSSAEGRSSTANSGTKAAVLPKAGLPLQTQEPRLQFYQGWISAIASRCFPHPTLLRIWRDLKRSQNIPGATTWRWEEYIWLTGPSYLRRNSPQGLSISTIRVF